MKTTSRRWMEGAREELVRRSGSGRVTNLRRLIKMETLVDDPFICLMSGEQER